MAADCVGSSQHESYKGEYMLNKELQTFLNKNLPRVTAFTFVFYPSDISFDDDLLTRNTVL